MEEVLVPPLDKGRGWNGGGPSGSKTRAQPVRRKSPGAGGGEVGPGEQAMLRLVSEYLPNPLPQLWLAVASRETKGTLSRTLSRSRRKRANMLRGNGFTGLAAQQRDNDQENGPRGHFERGGADFRREGQ